VRLASLWSREVAPSPLLKHFYGTVAKMIGPIAMIQMPLGCDSDDTTADHF
jgi:hypothetical protein